MATIVQEEIGTSGLINQENYDKNSIPLTSMSRSSKEITHGNLLGRNLEEGTAGETSADDIAPENATEERIYPHGFRLALLTVALLLATFVTALDTAIIATAVPKITTSFHSISDIGWYSSAYLLPLMSLQPTFGKIYSFFDIKTVFLLSLLVFETGSIICATSTSSSMFILGRAVAGIGGASLYAGGMNVISFAIPVKRISIFMGALGSMFGVAGLTGPPLGGLFTDTAKLTWRFCFWINLPFGGLALVMLLLGFKTPVRQPSQLSFTQKMKEMDFLGTILFVSGIACLFLALQWGGLQHSWSNSQVWGLMLGFGLLMFAFIMLQRHLGERATIPLRIFRNRSLVFSVLVAIFMSMGVNTHTFYLPFYFQSAKGLTAAKSGLRMLPYVLSVSGTELAVGTGVSFVGYFLPFISTGTAIFTIGAGLLTTLKVTSPSGQIIGYQILSGIGFGSSLNLCATAVRASVTDKDLPIANALTVFGPFFGGSLASSISQNIFRSELSKRMLQTVGKNETIEVLAAGASGGVRLVPDSVRPAVLEAFNVAVNRTFALSVAAGGLAFLCTLMIKSRNIKKVGKVE